jgi:L-threonylcarbamoyladenylate synthase
LRVDPHAPHPAVLAEAAGVLRAGRLVAFPTETFYGLGADALDAGAVERVFRAKGRPGDKPLLVLVDSLAMAESVVTEIPSRAHALTARYWPGPLTIILAARPHVPRSLTAGTGTLGVRLSAHPVALGLVRAVGRPVTAPSANPHGAPSPRTAEEVRAGLGAWVDLLLDGGPSPGGPPSTLVDATVAPMRIVRLGAVVLGPADLGDARTAAAP